MSKKVSLDIDHIATLANLILTDEEKPKLEKQLDETLNYISQLEQIDTKDVQPTNQVTGLENITRDDIASPSLSQEDALKNAKETHNGFIKVPQILEQ